ncbi:MAG TPA: patatin-like protein [Acidimicrobiales bacterium]|nr:patatin-like protein [Acidimicrobiales bacterium]
MPEPAPQFAPTQEVRFAVVMYGGSSLAIYMNGVTQELLHLVRATAPAQPLSSGPVQVEPHGPRASTEAVYRQLGQLLSYDAPPRVGPAQPDEDITTRFVVDIISGSSAGGINGVFLAKALSNDQGLEQLKRLWVDEGDFAKLLNDGRVDDTPGLPVRKPPESLMSGFRMYRKLLDAFDGMDEVDPAAESRLVEELDLAVTTTDLRGLPLPIKLYDSVIMERRYRNVFRLKYRTTGATGREQNDFRDANAGLAFAARCTSSFPLVFEPMVLDDIDPVLAGKPGGRYDPAQVGAGVPGRWDDVFFPDYKRMGDPYRYRSFGDGGDIDNKPFSYAIDNLSVRRSTVPVNRKLLYVEPDPGFYQAEPAVTARIDPITSVLKAASLPRAETIREDLDRVRAHNEAAKRVQEITHTVEEALRLRTPRFGSGGAGATGGPSEPHTQAQTTQWLDERGEQARARGLSYIVYHRLKVQQAVAKVALLIARAAGFDDESDHSVAVRILVQVWVAQRYADPFGDATVPAETDNAFLLAFDLEFRMRRINFVERRADELLCDSARARDLLKLATGADLADEDTVAFRAALKEAKAGLNAVYVGLRSFWRRLGLELEARVPALGITPAQLDAILVPHAVEQALHRIAVEGDPTTATTVDFAELPPPDAGDNPLVRNRLVFTVLGPRDAETLDAATLRRGPGDPTQTGPVLWTTGSGPAAPSLAGLDAAAVLVVDLPGPAPRVTMTVSTLVWPPTVEVVGDGAPAGAGPTATVTSTRNLAGNSGEVVVEGAAITRLVVRSAGGRVGDGGTPAERAARILADENLARQLGLLADQMRQATADAFTAAAAGVDAALGGGAQQKAGDHARQALRFFYDQFEDYDMATLPLLLSQGGDASQVDVLRVSPYDATSLVPADRAGSKLAGNQLSHYGAFLHASWRRNDIMWGRLDAAERLITALLPVDHPQREALLVQVQETILAEELAGPDLTKALSDAVLAGDATDLPEETRQLVRATVEQAMSPAKLREHVKTSFSLPPGPEPQYSLEVASRATRVVGEILKDLSRAKPADATGSAPAHYAALSLPGRLLARFGQFTWGLVEISVPGTVRYGVARYWLQLLAFVEVFLIVAGIALNQRGAVRLGWLTLFITLFVGLAKTLMAELLRRKQRVLRALVAVLGVAVLLLALFGGVRVAQNARDRVCRTGPGSFLRRSTPFTCPAPVFFDLGYRPLTRDASAPR